MYKHFFKRFFDFCFALVALICLLPLLIIVSLCLYLGIDTFPKANALCDIPRERYVTTIEDCIQCLYSSLQRSMADFHVGSIRKWEGILNGGFVVCCVGIFTDKPQLPDTAFEMATVAASMKQFKKSNRSNE